jgi:signal-transduction protein with cAMP-binding, CBS, and nucleotidyltransferase domain
VVTVSPNQTVASVAKVLTLNKIGAAPVIDEEDRLVGVIAEREIIRELSKHADAALTFPVEQLMTRKVKTCSPEDPLVDIMFWMYVKQARSANVNYHGTLARTHNVLPREENRVSLFLLACDEKVDVRVFVVLRVIQALDGALRENVVRREHETHPAM